MERVVSRVSTVVAIGLAVGLSLASGATLTARQDAAAKPAPKDDLLLAKDERPDVKEFTATLGKFYRVDLAAPAPPIYVQNVEAPLTTFSYHPGKIVYEILYYQKDGKEFGIPRAQADEIWSKLKDCYDNLSPWPLKKMGS